MEVKPEIIAESVKKDILSLGEDILSEVEAVGLLGSLVWGKFHPKHSDIDVFVILPDVEDSPEDTWELEARWRKRITNLLLMKYQRDVDVLFFNLIHIRKVCDWYMLSLASDGVLIYDKGKVKRLFQRVVEEAEKAGLERIIFNSEPIWQIKPPVKFGTIVRVELPDEEENEQC